MLLSCPSFERNLSTSFVALDPLAQKVVFNEELIVRNLSFCSADKVKISLLTKTETLFEASIPLRSALPKALVTTASRGSLGDGGPCHIAPPEDAASLGQMATQRVVLRPVAETSKASGTEPFVELELLQLVDSSLTQLQGALPLLRAINTGQAVLLRGLLGFEAAATLQPHDQAACITAALLKGHIEILSQLLEHMKPQHEHLLLAIRRGSPKAVEALMQARRGGSACGTSMLRQKTKDSQPGVTLTPLALACSLGDYAVVEALFTWATRERAHLDPTAPLVLKGGHHDGSDRADAVFLTTASVWHERGEQTVFGDPPMVMVIRGRANLRTKLRLLALLAHLGLEVDVRSPVDSWTPLLAAVELGSIEIVMALEKLGARISAEKHLGFTPLHLACQMGQWHLVPLLTEAMLRQHRRVAAWGPSPQYVSLNLADAYGRTALDIALLQYFGLETLPGESPGEQKAVDILREFVHSRSHDDGMVCGWDMLGVLGLLGWSLSSKKALSASFMMGVDCTPAPDPKLMQDLPVVPTSFFGQSRQSEQPCRCSLGPLEGMLTAIRVLVRAGGQTRWLLQDVMESTRSGNDRDLHYSPLNAEDAIQLGWSDSKICSE